jgi:hypothetical protein
MALFYFYFPRKEDVLFEVGVLSAQDAHRKVDRLLRQPYELPAIIVAVLATLEQTMRRNPPELLVEAVLEGYRQEQRALAEGRRHERISTSSPSCSSGPRSTASYPKISIFGIWPTWRSRWWQRVSATGRPASTGSDRSPRSSDGKSPRSSRARR